MPDSLLKSLADVPVAAGTSAGAIRAFSEADSRTWMGPSRQAR